MTPGPIDDAKAHMQKTIEATRREFGAVRTGRATPALLERITVDYYGVQTPVNQVATVTAPDPRLLVVQPWDKRMIKEVERAILKSELGLTPSTDGNVIRLPIPALTEERRRELVKVVRKHAVEGRVPIVRHRRIMARRRPSRLRFLQLVRPMTHNAWRMPLTTLRPRSILSSVSLTTISRPEPSARRMTISRRGWPAR